MAYSLGVDRVFLGFIVSGLAFALHVNAEETISQEDFNNSKFRVLQTYEQDKAGCVHYTGKKNGVCLQEAEAKKDIALADLQAQLKGSPDARNDAEKEKVQANYSVAKQLCEDMIEQDTKAMCNARAKADRDSALADIATDRKQNARREVIDTRQDADYEAEIKKCDSLPGGARDLCRENTRKLYGKG